MLQMTMNSRVGIGRWAAMLAIAGAAMAMLLASANTLAWQEGNATQPEFQEPESEPQSAAHEQPAPSTAEDFARPSTAVDPKNPSRRCGNLTTIMLDPDDMCQYAQSAGAMVSPQ